MTREDAKKIGLKAAIGIHSRCPVWLDGHTGEPIDWRIEEIIRILNETEQIHPTTIDRIRHRRRHRPYLKAAVLSLILAGLIVALAWWFL